MAGKLTCKNIETTQASSVATPSITGPDTAWKTLQAGILRYRKNADGMVLLHVVEALNTSESYGPLPPGYKPGFNVVFTTTTTSNTGTVGVVVDTAGIVELVLLGTGGSFTPHGGVFSYLAEA